MNDALLRGLRDIHGPPPATATFPDGGLAVLLLLLLLVLLVLLALVGHWAYRRYRVWHRQRPALRALAVLRAAFDRDGDSRQLAAGLSTLLRRVALYRFPPAAVAGLCGDRWLVFLDETGGGGRFVAGPGRVLTTAPYTPTATLATAELCAVVADWLRRNA